MCLPNDAAHSRVSVPEIAGRVLLDEADLQRTAQLLARLRYYARYLDEVEGRAAEM